MNETTIYAMDDRVRLFLEKDSGFALASFPTHGIEIRQSPARTDEPNNRVKIYRLGNAALATGIPRAVYAIEPVIRSLDILELFSLIGLAELRRALGPEDAETLSNGFDYTMTGLSDLRLPKLSPMPARLLELSDVPPEEAELSAPMPQQKAVGAFAIYQDGRKASGSGIIWRSPALIEIVVSTEQEYRGRGYALAVVAVAAQWILNRGAVAHYGAFTTNIPSLRIARRLGFTLAWQTIGA
ncbi:MAG: GNAT family N-acetyltransferase [Planctomycetota bacterium]|nr:GNAT family N-acetyltransferase [Planctomycetota bacterium]